MTQIKIQGLIHHRFSIYFLFNKNMIRAIIKKGWLGLMLGISTFFFLFYPIFLSPFLGSVFFAGIVLCLLVSDRTLNVLVYLFLVFVVLLIKSPILQQFIFLLLDLILFLLLFRRAKIIHRSTMS